jgi:hypothetical protein
MHKFLFVFFIIYANEIINYKNECEQRRCLAIVTRRWEWGRGGGGHRKIYSLLNVPSLTEYSPDQKLKGTGTAMRSVITSDSNQVLINADHTGCN